MLTLPKSQACAEDADDQRDDKENNAADLGQLGQLGVHAALTASSHRGGAFAHDRARQTLALLLLSDVKTMIKTDTTTRTTPRAISYQFID